MTIRQALYDYLRGDATIAGLVGTKIYPAGDGSVVSPNLPYITWERISNDHQRDLVTGSGLTASRFDLTSWAATPKAANALATAVRERIDNFRHGDWGTPATHVQACYLEDDDDLYVGPDDGSNVGAHGASQVYAIWHEETTTP